MFGIAPNALPAYSPPPSLSPPLSYGVTPTMPVSLNGTGRSLNDPYANGMTRLGFNHNYSNELLRYSNLYPQTQRATDTYPFSSTNGTYQHPPNMPLEATGRPVSTRQDGPPFDDTIVVHPVITSRHHQLTPDITASIQKGFFQVDGKWTCYRRNYFTVSCSFNFRTSSYDGQLYLQRHSNHQVEPISQFAISISAKTAVMNSNQESEIRALVQHTPKRDKATESIPGKVTIQPAPTPSLASSAALSVNGSLFGNAQLSPSVLADYSTNYSSTQHQTPPISHTFERIQFQKATANNGKRRAQQQYFHIVVELSADVSRAGESPHWVKIATKQSEPMVVRGRSPGHYKDNGRRDSTTSMDPDRGSGAAGDSGAGIGSMGGILGSSRSHPSSMDWESTHHSRSGMGGGYRRVGEPNRSPSRDGSDDSASGSPTDLGTSYQAMHSTMPSSHDRVGSRVVYHSDPFSSTASDEKGVQRLNLRYCGVDMTLPKPSYSSSLLDFGIYGTQNFDRHMFSHSQAVCSS